MIINLKKRKKSNPYSFLLFSFYKDASAYYNYKARKPNRNLAIKVDHKSTTMKNRIGYCNKRKRTSRVVASCVLL